MSLSVGRFQISRFSIIGNKSNGDSIMKEGEENGEKSKIVVDKNNSGLIIKSPRKINVKSRSPLFTLNYKEGIKKISLDDELEKRRKEREEVKKRLHRRKYAKKKNLSLPGVDVLKKISKEKEEAGERGVIENNNNNKSEKLATIISASSNPPLLIGHSRSKSCNEIDSIELIMSKEGVCITDLPTNALEMIFYLLMDVLDIFNLARTCTFTYNVFQSTNIYKYFTKYLTNFPSSNSIQQTKLFNTSNYYLLQQNITDDIDEEEEGLNINKEYDNYVQIFHPISDKITTYNNIFQQLYPYIKLQHPNIIKINNWGFKHKGNKQVYGLVWETNKTICTNLRDYLNIDVNGINTDIKSNVVQSLSHNILTPEQKLNYCLMITSAINELHMKKIYNTPIYISNFIVNNFDKVSFINYTHSIFGKYYDDGNNLNLGYVNIPDSHTIKKRQPHHTDIFNLGICMFIIVREFLFTLDEFHDVTAQQSNYSLSSPLISDIYLNNNNNQTNFQLNLVQNNIILFIEQLSQHGNQHYNQQISSLLHLISKCINSDLNERPSSSFILSKIKKFQSI
eukprot:TRINITY_DN2540_c0_g1_i1.p1 TRINITY_DN2540_c0_g1~~TRINITY_DN2540_c0_g1_i1.p1  ORF type:complete len:566 (-),score=87.22 TRINITY_DN2540_c0_g1_i1:109-1806(-)